MIIYDTEAEKWGITLSCFIYTTATTAGSPAHWPFNLSVCEYSYVSLSGQFENCDKGPVLLPFLFVQHVLETWSPNFNLGYMCGKEELVLKQFSHFYHPHKHVATGKRTSLNDEIIYQY